MILYARRCSFFITEFTNFLLCVKNRKIMEFLCPSKRQVCPYCLLTLIYFPILRTCICSVYVSIFLHQLFMLGAQMSIQTTNTDQINACDLEHRARDIATHAAYNVCVYHYLQRSKLRMQDPNNILLRDTDILYSVRIPLPLLLQLLHRQQLAEYRHRRGAQQHIL